MSCECLSILILLFDFGAKKIYCFFFNQIVTFFLVHKSFVIFCIFTMYRLFSFIIFFTRSDQLRNFSFTVEKEKKSSFLFCPRNFLSDDSPIENCKFPSLIHWNFHQIYGKTRLSDSVDSFLIFLKSSADFLPLFLKFLRATRIFSFDFKTKNEIFREIISERSVESKLKKKYHVFWRKLEKMCESENESGNFFFRYFFLV